jgi:TetR/AcrR family transcriptional repressor of nem operon
MARPAGFDRDRVLGQAMQTFWDRGYCATSVSQLVEATGLRPGSLYAAFDSKEGLFLAVLDHYAADSRRRLQQALEGADDPLAGIEHFLRTLVQAQYATQPPRGCLLVNTALELGRHNPKVQQRIRGHLEAIEAGLRQALEAARSAGQLGAGRSPAALARLLMTTIWGLRVLGGTGADVGQAELVVDQIVAILHQG